MIQPKNGEVVLQENELRTLSLNEKRSSYYPINTVLDFTGNVGFIKKTSSAGRDFLVLVALKNDKEARIPASMILRQPFDSENTSVLEKNELMRQILKCENASDLWNIIKGRKIKVTEMVEVQEVPFGEKEKRAVKYSIFDFA